MRITDPDPSAASSIRLQKYLSSAGVCSRRQGERLILKGRVRVNGEVVTELGTRVNPERDSVDVDGQPVAVQKELIYIALNKPKGYVASCHQPGDKTVMALVVVPTRIYPVGRLDKESTGLLLLTNDGRLHHRLSHPSFDHEKAYDVTVTRPISEGALEKMAIRLAASHADIGLKERTFNDAFDNVMLYVSRIDTQNKKLIDVFIEDKRQPDIVSTVVAPEGRLFSEPEKFTFHLLLSNGTIHQTNPKDRSATSIQFDTYMLSLDFKKEMENYDENDKHRESMSIDELRQYMEDRAGREGKDQDYYKAKIVLHRRFSIPIACLAMGLIAFPLGIQSKNAKRSFGLVLCLFFFLMYYLLLTIGYGFGEDGSYPPEIGMWVPNVVMGGIGLFMLIQTGRERSLMIEFFVRRVRRLVALIVPSKRSS